MKQIRKDRVIRIGKFNGVLFKLSLSNMASPFTRKEDGRIWGKYHTIQEIDSLVGELKNIMKNGRVK